MPTAANPTPARPSSSTPPRISTTPPAGSSSSLAPPTAPFTGLRPPSTSMASISSLPPPASLSLNYIPAKFSRPHSPGIHHRKTLGPGAKAAVAPRGGGRAAFAEGESRMPEDGDEDYDGWIAGAGKDGGRTKPRLRWNRFKWVLFCTNLLVTAYTLTALIFLLLTWFNTFPQADVIRTANRTELIISTAAAALGLLTSLLGWSGILLNNRAFLSVYCLLLWVSFVFLVAPGYLTYKRKTFNLEGKINSQWSREIGVEGRLRVQNQLRCCGYYSPFVEATISQTCYARSTLPGCKSHFLHFERDTLERWYTIAFSLVPLHLIAIVTSLLCSNHVTYRFGKGMMPRAYRLSLTSMAVLMDSYASQLADQYNANGTGTGTGTAAEEAGGVRRVRTREREREREESVYFDAYYTTDSLAEPQTPNTGYGGYDGEEGKKA